VELDKELDAIQKRGLAVAAISYDSVAILEDFARRRQIRYPLLSDPGSVIIRRFGLLNTTFPEGDAAHGVPWPGRKLQLVPLDRERVPEGLRPKPKP
jgi:peroxiredoxin